MLPLARNALRPASTTLSRHLAARAAALHTLPSLPYAYDALEPHICKEIMELHHTKHHQTYVNGLNAAEESYAKTEDTKQKIVLQSALKFNGGGHINHSLFWKNLSPASQDGGKLNDGILKEQIIKYFGSVDGFKKTFNATTAAIQGSGWGWLALNSRTKALEIVTTANQDPLTSHIPIIGVDIWEHAFYLQYKNVKPDVSPLLFITPQSPDRDLSASQRIEYNCICPINLMTSNDPRAHILLYQQQYLNAIWNVINFKEAENRLVAALN